MNIMDLKQAIYNLPDDMEVRLAQQPAWPFEWSVGELIATKPGDEYYIVSVAEVNMVGMDWAEEPGWYVTIDGEETHEPVAGPLDDEEACQAWIDNKIKDLKPVFYIVEGSQIGYLPEEAKRALSW